MMVTVAEDWRLARRHCRGRLVLMGVEIGMMHVRAPSNEQQRYS